MEKKATHDKKVFVKKGVYERRRNRFTTYTYWGKEGNLLLNTKFNFGPLNKIERKKFSAE